ncbi:MAG: bifunctional precorrin-2 dehydrogenase/sirohydrochlorin ferrochelatase [Candidatus Binatia bacterium]|nr:bifunctional precorrin-2 dehydrogenase/sirohydrochlorin ferrochelatase [Candidatus Binatia bacterium]
MRYLPVMLDLAGRLVLVVGGGTVATRKVSRLLEAGARVRVVAIDVAGALRSLVQEDGPVELHQRPFDAADLEGVSLVFSATGDLAVEQAVFDEAERRGLWVNAADEVERCSFLMPAALERGPLQVAVSTGGASPTLATRVRDEIDATLGEEYVVAVELLGRLRETLPPGAGRARAFADLLDGGLLEAIRQGDDARVERMAEGARRGLARAASQGGEGEG